MAVFKNAIAPKSGRNPSGKSGVKTPPFGPTRNGTTFACGDNYGVGFKNPVCKERAISFGESDIVPKKAKSFKADGSSFEPNQVV